MTSHSWPRLVSLAAPASRKRSFRTRVPKRSLGTSAIPSPLTSRASPMTASDPRFFNRELSWLEFNQRVLDEARDGSIPLLERLKFVAITASNLDEFFMVRVGGLQSLAEAGSHSRDPSGMTPIEQLLAVSERTHRFTREQYQCYLQEIEPGLIKAGIQRLHPATMSTLQEQHVQQVFVEEVFSTFAPLMVATASVEEFPLLINRSMSVCVRLRRPRADQPDPRARPDHPVRRGRPDRRPARRRPGRPRPAGVWAPG